MMSLTHNRTIALEVGGQYLCRDTFFENGKGMNLNNKGIQDLKELMNRFWETSVNGF